MVFEQKLELPWGIVIQTAWVGSETHETYNEADSYQRTTELIRPKLWQVLQNVLRLLLTVGVPVFLLWKGGYLDGDAEKFPWWAILIFGALLGGVASTSASNFANLLWEILGIQLRKGIEERASKGCTEEESLVLRRLEYKRWVRQVRKASFFYIAWTITRKSLLPALLMVAILFTPVVIAIFVADPRFESILVILVATVICAALLAVGFGLATGIGIKSFFH